MVKSIDKFTKFKSNLNSTINSSALVFTYMPKNYNKEEAMLQMKKIQLIAQLAQDLQYAGVSDLARELNVSTEQLYKDFEKYYGHKYTEGLNKYELLLRKKVNSNLLNNSKVNGN